MRRLWWMWVAAAWLLQPGCGPDVIVDPAFGERSPTRIAVLPFSYSGDHPGSRTSHKVAAIRQRVFEELGALPYLHLQLEETDARLARAGLHDPSAWSDPARYREVARALEVDAYLTGEIECLTNLQGGLLYRQEIEGSLRLIDGTDGRVLIRIEHCESNTGGLLLGYSQSVEAIAETLDNSSDVGFLALARQFADSVVDEIPAPARPPQVKPPEIRSVDLQGAGRHLEPGDELSLTVSADAGLSAVAQIGGARGVRLPLTEESPGRYLGWYRVNVGDRLSGPVSVQVADRFGVSESRRLEPLHLAVAAEQGSGGE